MKKGYKIIDSPTNGDSYCSSSGTNVLPLQIFLLVIEAPVFNNFSTKDLAPLCPYTASRGTDGRLLPLH